MSFSAELCVLVFAFVSKGEVALGQIPGPNVIVSVKRQVVLDCPVSEMGLTQWTRTTNGTSNHLLIASSCTVGDTNAAYYGTEQTGDNFCRLIIRNATMEQGGVYTCFDGSSTAYRSLVTVIDPAASVVVYNQSELVEGDQLNISCSIGYNGPSPEAPSLRPVPYWKTSPAQNFTSTIYHPSMNVVTVVATVRVQKPTVPMFQCNTRFEITGNATGYNAIAPEDNLPVGNITIEMDVQYAPSKPSLSSRPDVITYNGVLCGISVVTCNSTGNPAPNYRWHDSEENVTLSNSSTLTLAEINRNYTCQAYNRIRNVIHTATKTHTVSNVDGTATVERCVFPHNETTASTVEGCDNGPLCNCSQGSSGIKLICNAATFPNASYTWSGPNVQPTNSPVYDQITLNGIYQCTAYFNKTLSNYTGDDMFPTGTKDTYVGLCSGQTTTPSNTISTSSRNNCDAVIAAAIAVGVILFILQTDISEQNSKR